MAKNVLIKLLMIVALVPTLALSMQKNIKTNTLKITSLKEQYTLSIEHKVSLTESELKALGLSIDEHKVNLKESELKALGLFSAIINESKQDLSTSSRKTIKEKKYWEITTESYPDDPYFPGKDLQALPLMAQLIQTKKSGIQVTDLYNLSLTLLPDETIEDEEFMADYQQHLQLVFDLALLRESDYERYLEYKLHFGKLNHLDSDTKKSMYKRTESALLAMRRDKSNDPFFLPDESFLDDSYPTNLIEKGINLGFFDTMLWVQAKANKLHRALRNLPSVNYIPKTMAEETQAQNSQNYEESSWETKEEAQERRTKKIPIPSCVPPLKLTKDGICLIN